MVKVILCAREPGDTKVDYSLNFNLPALPQPGDYISVHRSDTKTVHTEDFVVRHVWWMLETPETRAVTPAGEERSGSVTEVMVECEMALGPYATDHWREMMQRFKSRGIAVEEFDVARLSIRERDLKK